MISIRHGFTFAMPVVITAIVGSFLALVICFEQPIFGMALLPLTIAVWTGTYGIQIKTKERLYKEYSGNFGFKKGKWQSLDELPYLTVLRNREGITSYSKSNRATTNIDDVYNVYLLNNSHRKKVLLKKFDTKELAVEMAKKMALEFEKEFVEYSPATLKRHRSGSRK